MYLVKLDLSVQGLPRDFSLRFQRHFSQTFDCKTIFRALSLSRCERTAPQFETAVKSLFYSLYDIVVSNSIYGVVMSARYTLYNSSGARVAAYTRYFNFSEYVVD